MPTTGHSYRTRAYYARDVAQAIEDREIQKVRRSLALACRSKNVGCKTFEHAVKTVVMLDLLADTGGSRPAERRSGRDDEEQQPLWRCISRRSFLALFRGARSYPAGAALGAWVQPSNVHRAFCLLGIGATACSRESFVHCRSCSRLPLFRWRPRTFAS